MTNYERLQDKIALVKFLDNALDCVSCPIRDRCYDGGYDAGRYEKISCAQALEAWLNEGAE